MATLTDRQKAIGILVKKRLGKIGDPDPYGIHGIYRIQKIKGKKVLQRMDLFVNPVTHTPAQQAIRDKFRDGITAWFALAPAEREEYNKKAIGRHMRGQNLFLRYYMTTGNV